MINRKVFNPPEADKGCTPGPLGRGSSFPACKSGGHPLKGTSREKTPHH